MEQSQQKRPKFRDVEERQPTLRKSSRVAFFAPHTSECMATLPLISEMSSRLEKHGLMCQTHSIEDMKENVMSVSSKMSSLKLSKDEMGVMETLFRFKDTIVRLPIVCRLLNDAFDTVLVEMHTLDKDYRWEDDFSLGECFYRLPGTRILYLKDYLNGYSKPINLGLAALDIASGRRLEAAAAVLGIDRESLGKELPALMDRLTKERHRAILVEIPAPVAEGYRHSREVTRFELTYGFGSSNPHTLEEQDIESISSAFL